MAETLKSCPWDDGNEKHRLKLSHQSEFLSPDARAITCFLPDWALDPKECGHLPKDHLPNLRFVESARAHYAEALEELLRARARIGELESEVAYWKEDVRRHSRV